MAVDRTQIERWFIEQLQFYNINPRNETTNCAHCALELHNRIVRGEVVTKGGVAARKDGSLIKAIREYDQIITAVFTSDQRLISGFSKDEDLSVPHRGEEYYMVNEDDNEIVNFTVLDCEEGGPEVLYKVLKKQPRDSVGVCFGLISLSLQINQELVKGKEDENLIEGHLINYFICGDEVFFLDSQAGTITKELDLARYKKQIFYVQARHRPEFLPSIQSQPIEVKPECSPGMLGPASNSVSSSSAAPSQHQPISPNPQLGAGSSEQPGIMSIVFCDLFKYMKPSNSKIYAMYIMNVHAKTFKKINETSPSNERREALLKFKGKVDNLIRANAITEQNINYLALEFIKTLIPTLSRQGEFAFQQTAEKFINKLKQVLGNTKEQYAVFLAEFYLDMPTIIGENPEIFTGGYSAIRDAKHQPKTFEILKEDFPEIIKMAIEFEKELVRKNLHDLETPNSLSHQEKVKILAAILLELEKSLLSEFISFVASFFDDGSKSESISPIQPHGSSSSSASSSSASFFASSPSMSSSNSSAPPKPPSKCSIL